MSWQQRSIRILALGGALAASWLCWHLTGGESPLPLGLRLLLVLAASIVGGLAAGWAGGIVIALGLWVIALIAGLAGGFLGALSALAAANALGAPSAARWAAAVLAAALLGVGAAVMTLALDYW